MIKFERVSGYDDVMLPKRATKGSAGYDFYLTEDVDVMPNEVVLVPTGIRCQMPSDIVLMLFPRSGLGFKYGMRFANTTGIIDSDYYYSDNEGHMMCKFTVDKELHLKKGERFMQGVFVKYYTTDDDNADGIRNGGFGSSGRV